MTSDVKGWEEASEKYPDLCDFMRICMKQMPKSHNAGLLECFQKLYDRLASVREHDNLILYSFPSLTQFSVSLLLILGHIFEEVLY